MKHNFFKSMIISGILCMAFGSELFAQKEFPLAFKGGFPVDADWKLVNEDRSKVLAGDMKEIAMVDTRNGTTIWTCNFKEKLNMKKCQEWSWDEDLSTVRLVFKGDKDNEKVVLLDDKTGNTVEKGTKTKLKYVEDKKAKSYKTNVHLPERNTILLMSYDKKKIVAANKAKATRIEIKAEGDIKWTTEIDGMIVRNLCNISFGGFGGDYLSMDVVGDKVFVMYEGLSVLDLNTGKLLWTAALDNSEFDFGLMKQRQTLGRAGMPFVTKDAVYVVDLSKGNFNIKKYNIEDGKVMWTSAKFDNDAVVPELLLMNNVLLARFGGLIEEQTHVPGSGNVPETCKSESKMKGDFGIKAYDAATGAIKWETSAMKEQLGDKFSSSISNFEKGDDVVYVASDKNLFGLEPASGKIKFKTLVSKLDIGNIQTLFMHNNNLIAEGEEGVASFRPDNGAKNYAVNTDKCLGSQMIGDAYILWVGKSTFERNQFVRMNISTGEVYGKMKDTYRPFFTLDGEEFVKFDGQKFFRYKTRQ